MPPMKNYMTKRNITALTQIAAFGSLVFLGVNVSPAFAATLSRGVDVGATLSAVWSMICPFCAVKHWLRNSSIGTAAREQRWQTTLCGDADRAQRSNMRSR